MKTMKLLLVVLGLCAVFTESYAIYRTRTEKKQLERDRAEELREEEQALFDEAYSLLCNALFEQKYKVLKNILSSKTSHYFDLINTIVHSKNKETLLHRIVYSGDAKLVNWLLKRKEFTCIDAINWHGKTALYLAVEFYQTSDPDEIQFKSSLLNIITSLLKHGAKVNILPRGRVNFIVWAAGYPKLVALLKTFLREFKDISEEVITRALEVACKYENHTAISVLEAYLEKPVGKKIGHEALEPNVQKELVEQEDDQKSIGGASVQALAVELPVAVMPIGDASGNPPVRTESQEVIDQQFAQMVHELTDDDEESA